MFYLVMEWKNKPPAKKESFVPSVAEVLFSNELDNKSRKKQFPTGFSYLIL